MIAVNNITKIYTKGSDEFIALDAVNLTIGKGEFVVVNGPSGAGKSTLLNSIGGLIRPDSGEILFSGRNIYRQKGRWTNEYRKKHVGFMFQQFHLMPYLTVFENIKSACNTNEHRSKIMPLLESCSLSIFRNKYPSELSVGEKQRTAFIRAIISSPDVLLADEPTGNLDPDNSNMLMSLVEEFHKVGGTVILVSHDPLAAKYATRSVILAKGRILS